MKQFRSTRGSLAARVREGLFSYFGENTLSRITTSDTPTDIANWKKSKEVAQCYKKLFDDNNKTLAKVLEKVFGKNLPSDVHSAYAIAICTTILNPKNEGIQLDENTMKKKVSRYLVSFIIFSYMTYSIFIYLLILSIYYLLEKNQKKQANST